MTYRLWIPRFRPALLNQLMHCHWTKKHRMKKADADLVAAYVLTSDIPEAKVKRRLAVEIILGPRMRVADGDNVQKSLHDALVRCHALRGDSPRWLEAGPVVQRRAGKGEEWGTWLTLSDVEDLP